MVASTEDVEAVAHVAPIPEGVIPDGVTHWACHHAISMRRRYDGVEVCRDCMSARTGEGLWGSVCRLEYPDGSLRTLDGNVLYRDRAWSRSR